MSNLTEGQKVLRILGKSNLILLIEYLEIEREKIRKQLERCTEETFKSLQGKIQEIKSIEKDIKSIGADNGTY